MAKLPEYYAEEKARKALERQEKLEAKKKKQKLKRNYYNEQNENVVKYFYREGTIPKYNKYQCSCCGKLLPIENFHRSYSYANLGRADEVSQFHQSLCKDCSQKLFFFFYYHVHNKDEMAAIEHWCCATNTYWDKDFYVEARKAYDNNFTSNCIIPDYIAAIGRKQKGMGLTYWDSPTIKNRVFTENETLKDVNNNVVGEFKAPLSWSKEEVKLRKKIINTLRYDPFSLYPEEEARNMYYDLDLMIDETMSEDLLKLKAAVEIVCGLHEIERLRQRQMELEQSEASEGEIKAVVARRNSELQQITKFAQDNGFSERYATKKAKGAGTLTGIMNEMKEKMYEDSLVNYYDVVTCKELQHVADMSFEAIFKQIGLSDGECWEMLHKQTERIRKITEELRETQEELRKARIQNKKMELLYKARKHRAEEETEEEAIINEEEEDIELDSYLQNIQEEDSEYQEYLSKLDGELDGD